MQRLDNNVQENYLYGMLNAPQTCSQKTAISSNSLLLGEYGA